MPEDNKIKVFKRGTLKQLKGSTPRGGQSLPKASLGFSLAWKNAQKKDTKNRTSEEINKIIPHRSPSSTFPEWNPRKVPSLETSPHHLTEVITKDISPIKRIVVFWLENIIAIPVILSSLAKAPIIGQGDSSTKWCGWRTKLLICYGAFCLLCLFRALLKASLAFLA